MKTNSGLTSNIVLLQQLECMDLLNDLGMKWYLINEVTRRIMVKGVLQESLLEQVLSTINDALASDVKLL